MQVLLVEDDDAIATALADGLRREGYEVHRASTGEDALAAPGADFVLIDLGLPDLDGSVVCRRIRQSSTVPIIVITARSDEVDRVSLLELGADDYLVKPFGFRELVARMRAVLRRVDTTEGAPEVAVFEAGPLSIDSRTRLVLFRGSEVDLTPKEFDLLRHLASDPETVFTREDILRSVWDENWWGSTRTLDVHMASLRRKLDPVLLETVRGVGFRLKALDR
ncbi:MAG: response regulator transcription factor [Actinomycetia bacterium]|nr:response regulator transcription factor [Actinomycetes bacterium]